MNIPEVYLVEPYNAYAPKGRKKHWHEVVEEQALLARILAEQQVLQEASSPTVPPNSPAVSSQTVGNMAGGAGGTLPPQVFNNPASATMFAHAPSSGPAPYTCQFTNLTDNAQLYTYLWTFSTAGVIVSTSTEASPSITVQTASNATNVLTASLQVTNSVFGTPIGITSLAYASGSKPTVSAAFTLAGPSVVVTATKYTASINNVITFVNGSSTNNTANLTYQWNFGSASAAVSTNTNPTMTYTVTGNYTVLLGATGSYGIMNAGSRLIQIVA